jgi:hypothetical protein
MSRNQWIALVLVATAGGLISGIFIRFVIEDAFEVIPSEASKRG